MLLPILQSFYWFFHLRSSSYQSLIAAKSGGDFSIIFAALQFLLINKILEMMFTKKMMSFKNLKTIYIVSGGLLSVMLAFGMLGNFFFLMILDLLIIVVANVTYKVSFEKVDDIFLMETVCKQSGISNLVVFAVGLFASMMLKSELYSELLYCFLFVHLLTMFFTLNKWNLEVEEKEEKKARDRKPFKLDVQIFAYIMSGVLISIAGTFDLYYVKMTIANGYSLGNITLLAAVGSLITGVAFLASSKRFFELAKMKKFVITTRLLLGLFPIIVLTNILPMYPVFKVILLGIESYAMLVFQNVFLASRDKRSMSYLKNVKATAGYATFSGAVILTETGVISMWQLAIVSVVASFITAFLLSIMREQGWKFLNLKEAAVLKYDMVGQPVVLLHLLDDVRSKIGDLGEIVSVSKENCMMRVKMDNGEILEAYPVAFSIFNYATIRQLIFSYGYLNQKVTRIKIKNKYYENADDIYGLVDPDTTIVKTHSFAADGTLEVLEVITENLIDATKTLHAHASKAFHKVQ